MLLKADIVPDVADYRTKLSTWLCCEAKLKHHVSEVSNQRQQLVRYCKRRKYLCECGGQSGQMGKVF